jgi:2-dehydro-3-deoxy-D-arabinonate dehydratase
MKLYRTETTTLLERDGRWLESSSFSIDELFRGDLPADWADRFKETALPRDVETSLPPIESQEVWAAGVTYFRSREARMEESDKEADVYDRVYTAERPELFFKATPHRVVGHREPVVIRRDSTWDVPEPELALAIDASGRIFGYSIGNDMSSRSIEGENPLYLPQAKIYDGSCALGPCLYLSEEPLPPSTEISIRIMRGASMMLDGQTSLAALKRRPEELVSYLFRENSFPSGCYLLTGTGIVPGVDFTLKSGDLVTITIEPIGTLENTVR